MLALWLHFERKDGLDLAPSIAKGMLNAASYDTSSHFTCDLQQPFDRKFEGSSRPG